MKRFEVWLVRLDPVRGSEIAKTRPCVVISRDDVNRALRTCVVAPLTGTQKDWWWRVSSHFLGVRGDIALDQMRCIDVRNRALRRLGMLDAETAEAVKKTLAEMFS